MKNDGENSAFNEYVGRSARTVSEMHRIEHDPPEWTSSEVAVWLRIKIDLDTFNEWADDHVLKSDLGVFILHHRICIVK